MRQLITSCNSRRSHIPFQLPQVLEFKCTNSHVDTYSRFKNIFGELLEKKSVVPAALGPLSFNHQLSRSAQCVFSSQTLNPPLWKTVPRASGKISQHRTRKKTQPLTPERTDSGIVDFHYARNQEEIYVFCSGSVTTGVFKAPAA